MQTAFLLLCIFKHKFIINTTILENWGRRRGQKCIKQNMNMKFVNYNNVTQFEINMRYHGIKFGIWDMCQFEMSCVIHGKCIYCVYPIHIPTSQHPIIPSSQPHLNTYSIYISICVQVGRRTRPPLKFTDKPQMFLNIHVHSEFRILISIITTCMG